MKLIRNTFIGLALVCSGGVSADIVHLDDVIITFSLCVGNDCVNGESFGFDTIRLKENNLRIKFDDTSVSASFPRNDWQITANETTNGGQNKFSIDDITGGRTPMTIEASAPSHSLYVDDGGRLGLGTSTPVVDVHVKSGNTPTLRLEQDGTSGFTPQTWDVAGNEANFFVRDATNGSTLPFKVFPSAPTNALTIEGTTGDIGLGTQSPATHLHIQNSGFVTYRLENTSAGVSWDQTNSGTGLFRFNEASDATVEMEINGDGDVTISGELTTTGMTCGSGCDAVFAPEYDMPSISEHAAAMWRNGYLPNIGPTVEGVPVNLTDKTGRMLNELEKAHIYIEQLHNRLERLEALLDEN